MKRIAAILLASLWMGACSNEPKLDKKEERAVEDQMTKDQKAMDSLERVIKARIDTETAADTADTDKP
jgi:PBP1b-binding outer membrane lipoprotein LpoB